MSETKTVRMQRGPLTFQWRPCLFLNWPLRPMNRERGIPQVLEVRGVPESVTPAEVMRQMERTRWGQRTTELTTVDWGSLGLGKLLTGPQA